MKNATLLIVLLLAMLQARSQAILRYPADTTKFSNSDTTKGNELIIGNRSRKKTGAALINKGNGVTEFRYVVDSSWQSHDTLFQRRGDTTLAIKIAAKDSNQYINNIVRNSDTVRLNFIKANNYFDDGGTPTFYNTERNGNTVYAIIDDQTGETVTFNKITGVSDADVDGVMIRKKGSEYFKRNVTGQMVNIAWFGGAADYNGTTGTDNSVAFEKAVSYLTSNVLTANAVIYFPSGNYNFLSQLTTYPNIEVVGDNETYFYFDRMLPDTAACVRVLNPAHSGLNAGNKRVLFRNIRFIGNQSYGSLYPGSTAPHRNSYCFEFNVPHLNIENCTVHGFFAPANYKTDSYLITANDCTFSFNVYGLYFSYEAGKTNLGENIAFRNCVFGNNDYGLYNRQGEINVIGGSVDYNRISQIAYNKTDTGGLANSALTATNLHFEASTTGDYAFYNQGVMKLINCSFYNYGSTPEKVFYNTGSLILVAPQFALFNQMGYLVDGIAPTITSPSYLSEVSVNQIHPNLAQVNDGDFESGLGRWNTIFGGGDIVTQSNNGTKAIKVYGNGFFNGGRVESEQIPINKSFSSIYPMAFVNTFHAGGGSAFHLTMYDALNNQIDDKTIFTGANLSDNYEYRFYGWIPIPTSATTYTISLFSADASTTNYVLYDDIYVAYK